MDKLTLLQAYNAMLIFLDDYYFDKNEPDDLGSLLGGMQLLSEGGTFDPIMWHEWLRGIKKNKNITSLNAFNSMKKFLEIYDNFLNSVDIKNLLNYIKPSTQEAYNPIAWKKWQGAVNKAKNNN